MTDSTGTLSESHPSSSSSEPTETQLAQAGDKVQVAEPALGTTIQLVAAGDSLQLNFDPADVAKVETKDGNLEITFKNGSVAVIQGYEEWVAAGGQPTGPQGGVVDVAQLGQPAAPAACELPNPNVHVVDVPIPADGERLTLAVAPGDELRLACSFRDVHGSEVGHNMEMSFPGGGVVVIENFSEWIAAKGATISDCVCGGVNPADFIIALGLNPEDVLPASGEQGGPQGAENHPTFAPGQGPEVLGSLEHPHILDPTALGYSVPTPEQSFFPIEENKLSDLGGPLASAPDPLRVVERTGPLQGGTLSFTLAGFDKLGMADADADGGCIPPTGPVQFVQDQASGQIFNNDDFGPDGKGNPPLFSLVFTGALLVDAIHGILQGDGHTLRITSLDAVRPGFIDVDILTGLATVHLAGAFDHGGQNDGANIALETFNYTIQDKDGDKSTTQVTIEIVDSVPVAHDDCEVCIVEPGRGTDGVDSVGGNVMLNDDLGADQFLPAGTDLVSISFDGGITNIAVPSGGLIDQATPAGGHLTIHQDGSWTYTPPATVDNTNGDVHDNFQYTIRDGDGDLSSAVQPICIQDRVEPPHVTMTIGVDGKNDCVNEDTLTSNLDNQVGVHVVAQGDDTLTQLVITGFDAKPGWTFDVSTVDDGVNAGKVQSFTFDGATLAIIFNPGVQSYDGTFGVQPPANSDVDLGTLTAVATAAASGDPSQTLDSSTTLDVTVDADADPVSITAFAVSDTGGDGAFSPQETGMLHIAATFGDSQDGSETHTVVVNVPSVFDVTNPAGATVVTELDGSHTLTFTLNTVGGSDDFSTDVGIKANNTIGQDDYPFKATVTATETTTGDDECDTSDADNVKTVDSSTTTHGADDHPTAYDNKQCATESGVQNVVIIADVSGSMSDDADGDGPGNQSRLDLEKSSLTALVDKYATLKGPVTITLIAFASGDDHTAGGSDTDGAVNLGTFTFDSTSDQGYLDAIAAINSLAIGTLVTGIQTEYDDALITAQSVLEAHLPGQAAGTTNTVYFLSDGQPVPSDNDAAHTGWKTFVNDHGIEVVAVGLGSDLAGNATAIGKLAEVEDHNDAPLVVDDQGDLAATLTNTVVNASVSGNVITDPTEEAGISSANDPVGKVDTFGNDGAGALEIVDLVVDGVHYSEGSAVGGELLSNDGAGTLTFETKLGGILQFNFETGAYTYTSPADVDSSKGEVDERFTYTIQDKDGDIDPADLVICIQDKVEPPTVTMGIGANGQGECVEEDSKVGDPDNQVAVHAAAQGDDTLTQLVITGLTHQPGWTFDFTNLKTADVNVGASDFDATDGKITLVFNAGVASFDGKFGVQPPADSDVDLGTLTATATAAAAGDLTQTLDGATNLEVTVDANADPTHVTVFTVSDNGGNGTFSPNETGTVHVHATFGDFTDGSETHTVTLDVPVGFAVTNPAGGSVTTDGLGTHVTFTVTNGTGSLDTSISIKAGNDISSSDNVQFHATATATETTTGDDECDTTTKDNVATDTTTTTTHTFDDHPTAFPNSNATADNQPQDINLVIVFDRSGSMADDPGVPGYSTRLELAKAAVAGLFEAYQSVAGDLHIKIVDFSDTTGHSVWLNSPEEANAYLAKLEADGTTHYNDAIQTTIANYDTPGDPAPDADRTEVYFISDGQPNPQSQSLTESGTVNQWEDFLRDNNIDQAFAIGVGDGIPANDPDLEDIAYKDADHNGVDDGNSSIVVTNEGQLLATLVGTVAGPPVSGNVLTDPTADVFGADGKGNGGVGLLSIQVGTHTYTYNQATDEIRNETNTLIAAGAELIVNPPTLGGTLDFHFDTGAYTFTPVNVDADKAESFLYTIVDSDGDTAAANLTLTVTNAGGSVVTPLSHIGTDGNDTINESGAGADIVLSGGDGKDVLTGSAHNDHIQGGNDDDKLIGNAGNDILIGGAGNDTLVAGSGVDYLFGGDGDDLLVIQDTANFGHVSGGGTGDVDLSGNTARGDTLAFDGTLDLTALANSKIDGIETISMTEAQGGSIHAADTLTLNSSDVIDLGTGHFNPSGSFNPTGPVDFGTLGDRDAIKVDGDAGDTVNLSGGGWFNAGAANTQGGPNGYNLYVHDGGGGNEDAYVLVQTVVAVTGAS